LLGQLFLLDKNNCFLFFDMGKLIPSSNQILSNQIPRQFLNENGLTVKNIIKFDKE